MTADQPDNTPCPHRRVPAPWVVFVGTLSLFAGLNLEPYYNSGLDLCGGDLAGFPFAFYWIESMVGGIHFDESLLLVDIAIALGAAAGLTFLMRNGWQEFWHWLRTAGVEYESPEEES